MIEDDDAPDAAPLERGIDQIQHLLAVGQLDRARELGLEMVARDPNDHQGHVVLAQVALTRSDAEAALGAAQEAQRLAPDEPACLSLLGLALTTSGRFADAERAYRSAIELEPDDALAYELYAKLLSLCDRDADALLLAEHALTLDPDDGDAHALRARLLLVVRPRDWQISEESVLRALELDPDDAESHAVLGHVRLSRRDVEQAESHFRAALELEPSNQLALAGLAQALMGRAPLYRPFLRYSLFMGRLTVAMRVAVVLGLWMLVNVADEALSAAGHQDLTWWIMLPYLAFCLYTWLAAPITRWILARRYPWLRELDV